MAVSLYFGLPGCGKTTMLARLAIKGVNCGRYLNVYSNVQLNIPGVTLIDNSCIGQYELRDCLLLIDEATLFADSRDYKNFSKGRLSYFLEHRHRNADIILFTQQWDGVDRKIRTITDRVYYIKKGLLFGRWFSSCYRIPYDIIIPDPKKNGGGEKLGEIVQGYCKPPSSSGSLRFVFSVLDITSFLIPGSLRSCHRFPLLMSQSLMREPIDGFNPYTCTKRLFCCVRGSGTNAA